jgi:hypothetical protein
VRQFIRTRLSRALVGIPLVVALLAMSVSISGCKSLFDKQPATRAAAPAPRVPTGAEKFAAASDTLSTSLEAATRAFARGSSDATAIAAVRSFAADLPKLDKGVAADFAKTRKILSKVKSPDKDAIQARVERTYAETTDQRAERALMTWIVFEAEAIAAMAFVLPWAVALGQTVGGPYGGAIAAAMACAALSITVSKLWDMFKGTVFDFYGQGDQASARVPRGGQLACA